jgi:hypothetical protein
MHVRRAMLILLAAALGCQDKKTDGPAGGGTSTPAPTTNTPPGPTSNPPGPPAEGRIDGKPFRPEVVTLEGNMLIFRAGKDFDADLQFELPVPEGQKLEGREWTFGGGKPEGPLVGIVAGKKDRKYISPTDYDMTVRFTRHTCDAAEGSIDLTVKNPAGTVLKGSFAAEYRKTPAAPLGPDDAPYVHGTIVLKGAKQTENLAAGVVGLRDDGTPYSNEAFFPVSLGETLFSTTPGLAPGQLSSLASNMAGLTYRHVRVPPGDYLVYVRRDNIMSAWKRLRIKAGDQETVDLTVDPATTGDVVVTLPAGAEGSLALVPLNANLPDLGLGSEQYFNVATVKAGEKKVTVSGIPAGKYRAVRGADEAEVEVVAEKSVNVMLAPAKK